MASPEELRFIKRINKELRTLVVGPRASKDDKCFHSLPNQIDEGGLWNALPLIGGLRTDLKDCNSVNLHKRFPISKP